jgi:Holliday junction resolvasome RuvABC endonuclease subunit
MTRILGLDISSSTAGWGVIDDNNGKPKLVECGFFKPLKKGGTFERLKDLKTKVIQILDEYRPDDIAIEEIMKFLAGGSTASTIISLATVNRTVGLACYEYTGKEPALCSVMAIRHKLKFGKVFPKKNEIPALVEKHLDTTLPIVYGKKGQVKPETYDIADGCAVALYQYYRLMDK